MAVYEPRRQTATGDIKVLFPISSIDGLSEKLADLEISSGLEFTPQTSSSTGEMFGYMVSKGTCTDSVIVIPSSYNGYHVVRIGDFSNLINLKSVVIPYSITSIQADAFKGCTYLEDITQPIVASVDDGAFVDTAITEFYFGEYIPLIGKTPFPSGSSIYFSQAAEGFYWDEEWNSNNVNVTWSVPMSYKEINREFKRVNAHRNIDEIWGEIKSTTNTFSDVGSDTLTWSGDTTDMLMVSYYARVSEIVPTTQEILLPSHYIDYHGVQRDAVWNNEAIGIDQLCFVSDDGTKRIMGYSVRQPGIVDKLHFPEKGIYINTLYSQMQGSIVIDGFQRFSPHKCVLNPESLPENEELPTEAKDIFGAISEINDRIDLLHNPKVVDLEGTTWRLNDSITIDSSMTCAVDFVANGSAYNKLIINSTVGVDGSTLQKISYGKAINTVYENGVWDNVNYQYVTFTGGTDSTNLNLIDWCYTHGELLSINLSGLQPKVDEGLETEDKAIVGAINELNKKKPIIDVVALPTSNINKESFYQLVEAKWYCYGDPVENFTCICVETLPENPIPIMSDTGITTYFTLNSRLVYGYVSEDIGNLYGAPAGWHDVARLFELVELVFDGFVTNPSQSIDNPNMVLLVQHTLYTYNQLGWSALKSIGMKGEADYAEIFNDPANVARGEYSHAEGKLTYAQGFCSHAQGLETVARGAASTTEGFNTVAEGNTSHVQGKNNIIDYEDKYAHIVGNGTGDLERSNAHTIDWQGNGWFAGDIKVGGKSQDDAEAKKVLTEDAPTVDKIHTFDAENCADIQTTQYGIQAQYDTTIYETQYKAMADITFKTVLPIVAGEGVTFEPDENNQVVKINVTGGGSTPNNVVLKYVIELSGGEMVTDIINKMVDAGYQLGTFALFEFQGAKSGTFGFTIQHYGGNIYNIGGIDFSTFYSMANQVTDWSTISMWSFFSFQPPIPYYDESNEGQVLKIVNGVPTWTN